MNPNKERLLYFGIALLIVCVMTALGAQADEPGDVRGCYCTYNGNTGKFLFEPVIKIAHEKTWASEDGEPEVWVFRVWNLEPPEEDGKTMPVNILASRFIPADGKAYEVDAGTAKRRVRCPPYWRGASSEYAADH